MNKIISKRLFSTIQIYPKCINCVYYKKNICYKLPKKNTYNLNNYEEEYETAIENRNNYYKCGQIGKHYEFIGPTLINQIENNFTLSIFMSGIYGITNIICITPNTMFIPTIFGAISVLSGIFGINNSLMYNKIEKQEEQRLSSNKKI
jgi:hypothetical protein